MSTTYLILLSILGWGVGSIFYKVANDQIHPIMVSAIVTAVYIVLTPIAFLSLSFEKSLTISGVMFAVLGGLAMGLGSITYFYALRGGAAGQVTTLTALYPALTLLLSWIFMGEGMSLKKGIGIALAFGAVYLLSGK